MRILYCILFVNILSGSSGSINSIEINFKIDSLNYIDNLVESGANSVRQKQMIEFNNSKINSNRNMKIPDKTAHYYTLALQGCVLAGGAIFWKYSERWTGEFETDNEGYFRSNSDNGGADKLGHAYSWHLLTRAVIGIYERRGFSRRESVLWGITFPSLNGVLVELLDGYTTNGASTEDILFNLIGSGSAALLYLNPKIDDTFHLDWSYWPSRELSLYPVENDITTDYSGQMISLEMNIAGLKRLININNVSGIDYFQVGLSYYTRGYRKTAISNKERFAGITFGINFQEFLEEGHWLRSFVKYYKLPFSFVGIFKNLENNQYEFKVGVQVFSY